MEFDASHSWDLSKMTDETAMEMFLHFLTGDVYFFIATAILPINLRYCILTPGA